jgi:hypothetical protein
LQGFRAFRRCARQELRQLAAARARPALALRVYRQAMRRDDGERGRLRALVDGEKAMSGLDGPRLTFDADDLVQDRGHVPG